MVTSQDRVFYDNYFHIIEPIWKDFFAEKIGLLERNMRLQPHRVRLFRIQQEMQKDANQTA